MTNANDSLFTARVDASAMKVHCDACGYDIENVPSSDLGKYIGLECPMCGAEMLTQNDYDVAMALIAYINHSNDSVMDKLNRYMRDTNPGRRHVRIADEGGNSAVFNF